MNSGSSAPISTTGHSGDASASKGRAVMIAIIVPRDGIAGAFHDEELHIVAAMLQGLVGVGFQRGCLAAAGGFVSRDHQFRRPRC